MEEYARRHSFPQDLFRQAYNQTRTARRFLITCQDCGEQHEFMERMEPLPATCFSEGRMAPPGLLNVRGISTEERFKVGHIHVPIILENDNDER